MMHSGGHLGISNNIKKKGTNIAKYQSVITNISSKKMIVNLVVRSYVI
jgi:hypothetical protein